jgi:hypothetical protein
MIATGHYARIDKSPHPNPLPKGEGILYHLKK